MYVVTQEKEVFTVTINYDVQGKERKKLVEHISELRGTSSKYLGVPSCAYQVGPITVGRNGELTFSDGMNEEEMEALIHSLSEAGFEEGQAQNRTSRTDLVIQLPRDSFSDLALENLKKLIESKESLIKKALGVDTLPIEMEDDRISFPWFDEVGGHEEIEAYSHFIVKLSEMAQNQKRITAKEKDVENEKYAFRCFLLRLGFIGAEYKTDRKILLKNLSGSSAFKKRGTQ